MTDRKIVFILGVGRTGSTMLLDVLARHHEFAWVSNFQQRFPSVPLLSLYNKLWDNKFIYKMGWKAENNDSSNLFNFAPKPSEAYHFWAHHSHPLFARGFLSDEHIKEDKATGLRNTLSAILRYSGKKHFIQKFTGPPRIKFLRALFPHAKFIHITRDPRHTLKSFLNVDFWKNQDFKAPWWPNGFPDQYLRYWSGNSSPLEKTAIQIRANLEAFSKESAYCPEGQYLLVRYEDFLKAPNESIQGILAFLDMEHSHRLSHYVETSGFKYKRKELTDFFTKAEIDSMNGIFSGCLNEYGYGQ